MFSKAFSSAVLALAASRLVSAQTFTDCNPMEKTCPADPALGNQKVDCDLTAGKCGVFEELPGTTVSYDDKGALFSIQKNKQAPTMATHKRIFFGRLDVEVQAAQGTGIVTSVVLESKDLDEIDWEWVGADDGHVQSNYYGKGDTTTYDRAEYHEIDSPLTSFHTYSIDWTSERIQWIVDGNVLRTLKYEDAKDGTRFPQTPMEVKIGTWIGGGPDSPKGTADWAGGRTDFSEAPFNAWYKSISITDYAGGNSATSKDVEQYVWTDKTGSWESIKVVTTDGSDDEETSTSTKSEATKASESSKTKTTKTSDPKTTSADKSTTTEASSTESSPKTASSSETTMTSMTSMVSTTAAESTTTDSPSSTTSSTQESSTDAPEGAAAGIFASVGQVIAAGAAAVMMAQLI